MTTEQLVNQIHLKNSFLCVGLDTDLEKIPKHLLKEADPIFTFNKAIIDATHSFCVAYKPNTAFYEAYGLAGWASLERTIEYLNEKYPDIFTIADAKRGDIGNTTHRYAKAFFEELNFDALTVAPYMGRDSVEPFLAYENKHTILLALTSNEGSNDYQSLISGDQELYKSVLKISQSYINAKNLMYVVGATKAEHLVEIRRLIPTNFLLIPGIGAQGGNLAEVCKNGLNEQVGLLVNSSRSIIYAGNGANFAQEASQKARELQEQMQVELKKFKD